jgi:WD40 repeat protein
VWDLGKTKKCTNLKNHTSSVSAIKIHNDNELYSVSKDLTIRKWDLRVCENVTTSKIQDSELTFIANNVILQ